MDPRDDDIEFDFFDDEPATGETQSNARVRNPLAARRGSRGPVGPPRGIAPLWRLGTLVILLIFLVVIFALLIQSCAATSRHSAYAGYMDKVNRIAAASTANGKEVATTLTGLKLTDIEQKLRGIADQERQNVMAAQKLNPPGRLKNEHLHLIDALQLRVSGVDGLADTFQTTANSKDNSADANLLAKQADRLLASDVIWDDLFDAPTLAQLKHDGISGVNVPESHFVNDEFVTPHQMALVLQRIRGASTGGTPTGLHGTNIVSVKALPAGQTLTGGGTLNTITAGTDLALQVTIEDSGDSLEARIPVTLTIEKSGSPIVKTQTIPLINPGPDQRKTVTFTDLGDIPFGNKTTVKVDVTAVPGEVNKANNSAEYSVLFSLPGG
jgi:hypothetical protein